MDFVDKQKQKLKEFKENYMDRKNPAPSKSLYKDALIKALTVDDSFTVGDKTITFDGSTEILRESHNFIFPDDYLKPHRYYTSSKDSPPDCYIYFERTGKLYGPFSHSEYPWFNASITQHAYNYADHRYAFFDHAGDLHVFDSLYVDDMVHSIHGSSDDLKLLKSQKLYIEREISVYDLPKECFEGEHIVPFLQHYQTKFYEEDVKACSTAYLPELIEAYQEMSDYIKMEAFDGEQRRLKRIHDEEHAFRGNKELIDNALEQAQKLF